MNMVLLRHMTLLPQSFYLEAYRLDNLLCEYAREVISTSPLYTTKEQEARYSNLLHVSKKYAWVRIRLDVQRDTHNKRVRVNIILHHKYVLPSRKKINVVQQPC